MVGQSKNQVFTVFFLVLSSGSRQSVNLIFSCFLIWLSWQIPDGALQNPIVLLRMNINYLIQHPFACWCFYFSVIFLSSMFWTLGVNMLISQLYMLLLDKQLTATALKHFLHKICDCYESFRPVQISATASICLIIVQCYLIFKKYIVPSAFYFCFNFLCF